MPATRSALRLAAALLVFALALPASRGADEPSPIAARVKAAVKDPNKPFTLVIRIRTKEGAGKKLETAFARAAKPTRQEKGCEAYDLNRDPTMPGHYLLYERWQNLAALETHLKTKHTTTLLREMGELVASPPEAKILIPVGE